MDQPRKPRKRPCASCPYRRDVPSGVWHPEEYAKLPRYDGETFEQSPATFSCHAQDGSVCAGWLGHTDPGELLAVRIGIMSGHLDPSCAEYRTDVPLWSSGRAAAEHGLRDVDEPGTAAWVAMGKLRRARGAS
jgi:hypothetical protein